MPFSLKPTALILRTALFSTSVFPLMAMSNEVPSQVKDIETITITNQRHFSIENNINYAQGKTSTPDLANWLTSVPGANVNSNGPVTGIAQYRGLYGDRISATVDGHTIIGAGPNAMDTPLSYSTPLIIESMTVYRGIAPVSAGLNTLGGAIDIKMRKAEFSGQSHWQTNGDVQMGYRSNNNAETLSSVMNISKDNTGLLLYGNVQSGDDMESGDGNNITPTKFEKRQFGGDVRFATENSETGVSYHYTDTQDSGTPALPMDIESIFSHRINIDGEFIVSGWQAKWLVGYLDADHGMTNFKMRSNNDLSRYRRNNAAATTTDFNVSASKVFDFGQLTFGVDGYFAEHDSVITTPNNAMFEVVNFNKVEDNRYGVFVEWQQQFDQTTVQLGARLKRAEANAGNVSTSMAMMTMGHDMDMGSDMPMNAENGMTTDTSMPMPSMGELASDLQDDFNNADKKVSDNNLDIALSIQHQISDPLSLYFGLGVKNRAPSYQERYLWTPMEATGGLGDGNTYIGNINLNSETAYQTDIGLTYQSKTLMLSPHIFYQRIDDYIQGTPLGMYDMSAKMMAQMMAGDNTPLKFTNVDAKLYGADVNAYYDITNSFRLSGIVSYVKGERRDISDNLYRVAPLNGHITASYYKEQWLASLSLVASAFQNNVSETNNEQKSAGYGVINIDLQYFMSPVLTLRAGIDNLLDKEYKNHLGGYNRVKDSDIAVMDRLPSEGLSAWAELSYSF